MSIKELDLILNKEAIIATYRVEQLSSNPDQVEQIYRTYARTHVPLGDTNKYVDTLFKWIGGGNQGAFIGAIAGHHGHGKTSFQIHIWDRCAERKVFSVPPFEWDKVSHLVDGVAAWIQYILSKSHAELAGKAQNVYDTFKEKSLQEVAEQIARNTNRDVDDVLATLRAAEQSGTGVDTQTTPERFLDYCAEVTELVKEAGYSGLLVLLDEPEHAARSLGTAKMSQVLFDIANGLLQRQGDYGVFVSMPETFLALVQATFAALPARLQGRNCFPRLSDMYGTDFARTLWDRYVKEFDLGEEASRVVSDETLEAIGQVASPYRSDLSYGPRTVVSAFTQMVYCYREKNTAYSPIEFVKDCLDGAIKLSNYPTRIREILDSPEVQGVDQSILMTLAAFPNGLTVELAERLGIDSQLSDMVRRPGLAYKRGNLRGLTKLQKQEVGPKPDELVDILTDIAGEFAPGSSAFASATSGFIDRLIPKIFEPRQGQQLLGWDIPEPERWREIEPKIRSAELVGAFRQTEREYPQRTVAVVVGPLETDSEKVLSEIRSSESPPDIVIHFRIRWSKEDPMPEQRIEVTLGEPTEKLPGTVRLVLDFADNPVSLLYLEEKLDRALLTPLGVLFLINEKHKRILSREYEAEWSSIQDQLIRELLVQLLGDQDLRSQASEQIGETISGEVLALLGLIFRYILRKRYPDYRTLMCQLQWQKKIDDYTLALKNTDIPLSCKRGRGAWSAPGEEVAKAFGTSLMNLTGGAFTGFGSLISIESFGRDKPVQVNFKLHPLEQLIMDKIVVDNPRPKLKFDGKECWYVPLDDVWPLMRYSGYSTDELKHIVEIGKTRGSFGVRDYKGERLLYCKPLDLDQMKAQLGDKLADLEKEIGELNKLPDFPSRFDCEATRKDIAELKDEVKYDTLQSRMNREFERLHGTLGNYSERLDGEIGAVWDRIDRMRNTLKDSREVKAIEQAPKATSRWCADLNTYIRGNLKVLIQELNSDVETVRQLDNTALIRHNASKLGKPLDRAAALLEGWNSISEMKQQLKATEAKASAVFDYLRGYDQWTRVLSKSDDVNRALTDLQTEQQHAPRAKELIGKLETIWQDISAHLQTRNVHGLGSHNQYYAQFEELDEECRKYMQGLRSAFEEKKKGANELLEELDLGEDYRCKEVFNRDDSQGCYQRLYLEAAKQVEEALSVERREIDSQRQELLYARDILSQLPGEQAEPLTTQLSDCAATLDAILGRVNADWTQLLVGEPENQQPEIPQIKDALRKSREAIRSTRMAIRPSGATPPEELSATANEMMNMIPQDTCVDLKQLILGMMKSGRSSSDVLSESLSSLVELFRKRNIKITVERLRK
ncbi:MAG: hypothetical protein ISS52_03835 [Dehalococcoidia bacterium]|nr:hypothetical protein [Dehalococcoidia bacterium]